MYRDTITDIFFDLDHTLWDFDKNSSLAFARVFKAHKVDVALNDFLNIYEPINFDYWKLFREDKVSKMTLRRGRLIDTFQRFGIVFSTEKIDLLAEAYIDELPGDNHLLPGSMELLGYLTKKYRLHIITNGFDELQRLKLQKSGINDFFLTVTSSEEAGVKKPNPIIFELAVRKANTKPSQSLMIGDTYEADVLGAASFGMKTIFYNYRSEEIPNHFPKVDSLLEIKSYL